VSPRFRVPLAQETCRRGCAAAERFVPPEGSGRAYRLDCFEGPSPFEYREAAEEHLFPFR
jgi:hypothetical protein